MENNAFDRFTFFRSYFDVEQQLKTQRDKLSFLEGVLFYAFEGRIPEMTSAANLVFTVVKPTLDVSKKRSVSGRNARFFQDGKPDLPGENRDFAHSEYRNRNKNNRNENKEWNIHYD